MTADLGASTYLVDGVDVLADGVKVHHDGAGLWSGLTEEIATDTVPGVDGGNINGGTFVPYTFSTMFIIRGTGYADVWSKIVALRRRCKPGLTVTLTRRMPDPDGTDINTDHTATARRLTDRPAWRSDTMAVLDVDWWVTDPWHGAAVAISPGAGIHTILGDTRTTRMTVTLDAGAARTVSNSRNGFSFQFLTTVPAGGVLVDVEAETATAITGGADYSGYLRRVKNALMQLEAGSNTLTTDTGTFSVSYQPAYL